MLIPSGVFLMGSDDAPRSDSHFPSGDARPVHPVRLDAFCIDQYEVSLERYESCVDAGVCTPDGLLFKSSDYQTVVNHYPAQCESDLEPCRHHAVNTKSYHQAQAYCAWIGSRLCTEAEWERAANGPGPERRPHPWGEASPTAALANLPAVGSGFIDPVDSHPDGASVEGVFNLAGNVYEWVRDRYQLYVAEPNGEPLPNPVSLPTSDDQQVVGRGACFFTEPADTVTERSRFEMSFDWG